MAAPAYDWWRHITLLWNRWTEFNETWQEARSQRHLPSLCFSGRSENQEGRHGLWLADTFSTFPLKLLNEIQQNLTESKISISSIKFLFFGPIGKRRLLPRPLICSCILDFSSETAERNLTKPDWKQDLNFLYQVCVFRPMGKTRSPARSLIGWEISKPLKPLNGNQRHLTGNKISTSSTKFVFFEPIGKIKWPPRSLISWDIFDFFSETADWNSTKLAGSKISTASTKFVFFRPIGKNKIFVLAFDAVRYFQLLWNCWMEFNETWQEAWSQRSLRSFWFFFWTDRKNKMAAPASEWPIHFGLLLWNHWTEFNETWQEARSQRPLQSLCFSGLSENKMVVPASNWLRHFRLLLWNRWIEFNETWREARSQYPLPSLCFSGRWVNKNCCLCKSVKYLWNIVLRCTVCGPLGLLFFSYLLLIAYTNLTYSILLKIIM